MKRSKSKTTAEIEVQLQRMLNRLQRRIDNRAADPAMAKVAGGDTGLVIRREHRLMVHGAEWTVYEHHTDTTTIDRQLRILERARLLHEES